VAPADLELVDRRVLNGRVFPVEYLPTGKNIPRAPTPEIARSHPKAAEEERTHGHRRSTRHRRAPAARVLPHGLRERRRTGTRAALEAFRGGIPSPSDEQSPAMLSASVAEYAVDDVRPLFGKKAE
jgi:hypothetical protein